MHFTPTCLEQTTGCCSWKRSIREHQWSFFVESALLTPQTLVKDFTSILTISWTCCWTFHSKVFTTLLFNSLDIAKNNNRNVWKLEYNRLACETSLVSWIFLVYASYIYTGNMGDHASASHYSRLITNSAFIKGDCLTVIVL